MEKTDEEIASKVQAGEADFFGILVDRYESKISRYGRKFLADKEEIKDLVQDVFLKAYTHIQSFDVKRKFSPWLYRIAHNEFVNSLRKNKYTFLPLWPADAFWPHQLVAKETADKESLTKEIKISMRQSLTELDIKYREPLILFFFEDLSYQEIAEVLHLPVATVGVRINRGKQKLKKIYKK